MKNRHVIALSLFLGVAIVAGAFAVYQTVGWLDSPTPAAATIAAKSVELDRLETSIGTALASEPPPLPGSVGATPGAGAGAGPVAYDDDRYEPEDAYDDDRYELDDDRYEPEDAYDDDDDGHEHEDGDDD